MIGQLRVFKLVMELIWVKGLLVGFSLPTSGVPYLGLNLAIVCVLISHDAKPADCAYCRRPLNWGLHGNLFGWQLCKARSA
jgi:hypothetical protein